MESCSWYVSVCSTSTGSFRGHRVSTLGRGVQCLAPFENLLPALFWKSSVTRISNRVLGHCAQASWGRIPEKACTKTFAALRNATILYYQNRRREMPLHIPRCFDALTTAKLLLGIPVVHRDPVVACLGVRVSGTLNPRCRVYGLPLRRKAGSSPLLPLDGLGNYKEPSRDQVLQY